MQIRIEPTGSKTSGSCSCCANDTKTVCGFAHYEGKTVAAYFVHWTPGHSEHEAFFDLILGDWGEDATSEDRTAVSLAYRFNEDGPGFMVVDATDRPFSRSQLVGRSLRRSEVLGTDLASKAYTVADAVLLDDRIKELISYTLRSDKCDVPKLSSNSPDSRHDGP
jgi:hypothetical protein